MINYFCVLKEYSWTATYSITIKFQVLKLKYRGFGESPWNFSNFRKYQRFAQYWLLPVQFVIILRLDNYLLQKCVVLFTY